MITEVAVEEGVDGYEEKEEVEEVGVGHLKI